jgi:hypothetical protein
LRSVEEDAPYSQCYLIALPGVRSGFTIQSAVTHDLQIVAVSDVNPADLDALVAVLTKVQSSS